MKLGKQSISMSLHWRMAAEKNFSTMETGLSSQELRSAVVTMD